MSYKEVERLQQLNKMTDQELFNYLKLNNYTRLCYQCDEIFPKNTTICPNCRTQTYELSHRELRPYYLQIIDEYRDNNNRIIAKMAPYSTMKSNIKQQQYTPKCPVCQSPNIRNISVLKRGAFGATFGLFSKTARSQWECLDCGNKF